ncbi:hypothetical protein FACS1894219_11780 [Clostridia bacterium]|nr:hypothetical protein FACS1894219_11780 [Clostridia bacterium]
MAIKYTDAFLAKIIPLAIADAKKSRVLASLTIAQAILESDWGRSGSATRYNALFGIKCGVSWTGKRYNAKTLECYDGKNMTQIIDAFRAYDSWADSVADHSALLGVTRYKAVIGETDYAKACRAVRAAGYATAPNYADVLISIIRGSGLDKHDVGVSTPKVDAKFTVKDKVRVVNAVTVTGVKFKVYYKQYDIIQIRKDGAVVIGIGNVVTAAVDAGNLAKV